jgi:hypothetical protein
MKLFFKLCRLYMAVGPCLFSILLFNMILYLQNYNFSCCVWVFNLVADIQGGT